MKENDFKEKKIRELEQENRKLKNLLKDTYGH